jgi:hypothetical protein
VKCWSESTLVKFLELPEALDSGAVVYHLCSYLGSFPFSGDKLSVLTSEALLRVVCLMTGRHTRVLQVSERDWIREIWRGCAVADREALATTKATSAPEGTDSQTGITAEDQNTSAGASTEDEPTADLSKPGGESEDGVEDELGLRIFKLMGALESFKMDENANVHKSILPKDNFLKLVELLTLIAPLGPQETISSYSTQLSNERLKGLRDAAACVLASFGEEKNAGIKYNTFEEAVSNTLPHLFDSFGPLFEHFLVPKDTTQDKLKDSNVKGSPPVSSQDTENPGASSEEVSYAQVPVPLGNFHGDILNVNLLSQLSFIFSSESIFHRLRPLYLGHNHGYSMGSFEKGVFKWQKPTFLLVSGTLLSPTTKKTNARTFLEDLPYRRLSSSVNSSTPQSSTKSRTEDSQRIVYGAYIPVPWNETPKTTFGTNKTTLFQLSPVHDVFPASYLSQHYAYFNKPSSTYPGLGFGSPLPSYSSMTNSQQSTTGPARRPSVTTYSASDTGYGSGSFSGSFSGPSSPGIARRSSLIADEHLPLGAVSLHIDDALEFGVFTHFTSGVASFQHSTLPVSARSGNGKDWQDRFEIDAFEVWGVSDVGTIEEQWT